MSRRLARNARTRSHLRVLLVLLSAWALAACNEVEQEEIAASGATLCLVDYEVCINPIFDAVIAGRTGPTTCAGSGCHSQGAGSGGAFKIFADAAPDSAELLANFFSARAFANLDDPPSSKLLLEPLEGVFAITGTHTGGDIFPDTADPCYRAIRDWISRRVDDEGAAACGVCEAPPDFSACGYGAGP